MKILRYSDYYQLVETNDQIILTDVRTNDVRHLESFTISNVDLLGYDEFNDFCLTQFEV